MTPQPSSITNHVKSATYLDLVAEYHFDPSKWGELSVYGGINNLSFDPVGRNFKLGVPCRL